MADILARQYFPYAIFPLFWLLVYCDLKNYRTLLLRIIQQSESFNNYLVPGFEIFQWSIRREHRVFMELIEFYPGLLAHLMDGEEEDIIHIGELVIFHSTILLY